MRKFVVTVNGTRYEVEVEEIAASAQAAASTEVSAPAAPQGTSLSNAAATAPKAQPAPSSAHQAPAGIQGAHRITAPMPGTILDIRVNVGDSVRKGDVVAILEAMKMENEIMASMDGIVASVNVSRNQQVNSGDIIITLN